MKLPGTAIVRDFPGCRVITLSRQGALNTITLPMLRDLSFHYLDDAPKNPSAFYILKGDGGKSFSAGGDVLALTDTSRVEYAAEYYRKEYQLDYHIATMPRKQVALWRGLVLGSGVGLSLHGSHRVACDTTVFGMPETKIGMAPDVASTFKFTKVSPKFMGAYMAITGSTVRGADAYYLGLATHYVSSAKEMDKLEEELTRLRTPNAIDECLEAYATNSAMPSFSFADMWGTLERAFTVTVETTISSILAALKDDGSPFARVTMDCMKQNSPLGMTVALENWKVQCGISNIKRALEIDYHIASAAGPLAVEFLAGVDALLISNLSLLVNLLQNPRKGSDREWFWYPCGNVFNLLSQSIREKQNRTAAYADFPISISHVLQVMSAPSLEHLFCTRCICCNKVFDDPDALDRHTIVCGNQPHGNKAATRRSRVEQSTDLYPASRRGSSCRAAGTPERDVVHVPRPIKVKEPALASARRRSCSDVDGGHQPVSFSGWESTLLELERMQAENRSRLESSRLRGSVERSPPPPTASSQRNSNSLLKYVSESRGSYSPLSRSGDAHLQDDGAALTFRGCSPAPLEARHEAPLLETSPKSGRSLTLPGSGNRPVSRPPPSAAELSSSGRRASHPLTQPITVAAAMRTSASLLGQPRPGERLRDHPFPLEPGAKAPRSLPLEHHRRTLSGQPHPPIRHGIQPPRSLGLHLNSYPPLGQLRLRVRLLAMTLRLGQQRPQVRELRHRPRLHLLLPGPSPLLGRHRDLPPPVLRKPWQPLGQLRLRVRLLAMTLRLGQQRPQVRELRHRPRLHLLLPGPSPLLGGHRDLPPPVLRKPWQPLGQLRLRVRLHRHVARVQGRRDGTLGVQTQLPPLPHQLQPLKWQGDLRRRQARCCVRRARRQQAARRFPIIRRRNHSSSHHVCLSASVRATDHGMKDSKKNIIVTPLQSPPRCRPPFLALIGRRRQAPAWDVVWWGPQKSVLVHPMPVCTLPLVPLDPLPLRLEAAARQTQVGPKVWGLTVAAVARQALSKRLSSAPIVGNAIRMKKQNSAATAVIVVDWSVGIRLFLLQHRKLVGRTWSSGVMVLAGFVSRLGPFVSPPAYWSSRELIFVYLSKCRRFPWAHRHHSNLEIRTPYVALNFCSVES
eukprot:gene2027-1217_t